jgi:hypothetical protein
VHKHRVEEGDTHRQEVAKKVGKGFVGMQVCRIEELGKDSDMVWTS